MSYLGVAAGGGAIAFVLQLSKGVIEFLEEVLLLLFQEDVDVFNRTARLWTRWHAMGETAASVRVGSDWSECQREPVAGISLTRPDDCPWKWLVTVTGPAGTPYEGGVFRGEIIFPDDYPTSRFQFTLLTKLYSPGFTVGSVTIEGTTQAVGFLRTLHDRLFVVEAGGVDGADGDEEVRRHLVVGALGWAGVDGVG